MIRQEAEKILKEKFGLESFHDNQWETIRNILEGRRILLIEKTGFGKSLCYQFPATVFEGVTVIFSPLIALMRDQVKKLNSLGIAARCINSGQDQTENEQIIFEAKSGKIKILYIAPERQENEEWIEATRELKLAMVVIDEAHCISVWGHDFRPAFKRIIKLVNLLPGNLPVLAVTATATKRVEEDIARQIGGNIEVIRGNLLRDNLRLFVVNVSSEDEKLLWLGKNLDRIPGTGILYTGTRYNTEIYNDWLKLNGHNTTRYNAGLESCERVQIENGFMLNKWKCIISTNALGMGIDKPDIRFIIHTQIPQSPVHYYQEIGRAGRDGVESNIILLYTPEDRQLPESFIESSRPAFSKYERVIDAVKGELLSERELIKKCNLRTGQFRVIKSDLVEQGIIRELSLGRKKYEFIPGSPKLNTAAFEEVKRLKTAELDKMIEYTGINTSRMKFLCDYLGDSALHSYKNCDNTGLKKIVINVTPEWREKVRHFHENNFPALETAVKNSSLKDGFAASYFGVSDVGKSIHRSKYENGGDFPDVLIELFMKMYESKLRSLNCDLLIPVPPSVSGNLVRNFAEKISNLTKIPMLCSLGKLRQTQEQKIFQNSYLKKENLKNVFTVLKPAEIMDKRILLIDDVFDSGATMGAAGKYLSSLGAREVIPAVIAKTVGGDIK